VVCGLQRLLLMRLAQRIFPVLLLLLGCGPAVTPTSTFTPHVGCGDVFVVGVDATRTRFLKVNVQRSDVNAPHGQTVTLDVDGQHVTVEMDVYAFPVSASDERYCTDVLSGTAARPTTIKASSGTVTLVVGELASASNPTFPVTVRLENVKFSDGSTLGAAELKDVTVGWYAG